MEILFTLTKVCSDFCTHVIWRPVLTIRERSMKLHGNTLHWSLARWHFDFEICYIASVLLNQCLLCQAQARIKQSKDSVFDSAALWSVVNTESFHLRNPFILKGLLPSDRVLLNCADFFPQRPLLPVATANFQNPTSLKMTSMRLDHVRRSPKILFSMRFLAPRILQNQFS